MTAGQANRDLGRIEHDPRFARGTCEDCRWIGDLESKPKALRQARAHVAATTHTARIDIYHWQTVRPLLSAVPAGG